MALVVPPVSDLLRRSRAAQDGTSGQQPMFPTLVAVRNERVVATLSSPRIGTTLTAAPTMAVGLDPQALVLAAEATVEGRAVITYAVMTRERSAAFVLQDVVEEDGELHLGIPQDAGQPQDDRTLRVLADAMGQAPMDVSRISRKDRAGTFGEGTFLPPEQGRVVVDAGTVRTLQQRVQGIAGLALYVARSREAGRLALEAGLPRTCLLQPEA